MVTSLIYLFCSKLIIIHIAVYSSTVCYNYLFNSLHFVIVVISFDLILQDKATGCCFCKINARIYFVYSYINNILIFVKPMEYTKLYTESNAMEELFWFPKELKCSQLNHLFFIVCPFQLHRTLQLFRNNVFTMKMLKFQQTDRKAEQ